MIVAELAKYRPVVVEGMGYYDPRDPAIVANQIVKQLKSHWSAESNTSHGTATSAASCSKPKLLITQGDPKSERGISAITPLVGDMLGIKRGLVVFDDHIDPDHSTNAPRDNVILEVKYSELLGVLDDSNNANGATAPSIATQLEQRVDEHIEAKNQRRLDLGKPKLKSYFKDYAMLQEVTKAACRAVCGDITVAHTAHEISEFSVTSFYQVGLDLGLLDERHYVPYGALGTLDFDKIDTR